MKIIEKIRNKTKGLYDEPPITIAFLGDSVTQGCFEVYQTGESSIETVFDPQNAYSLKVKEIFSVLYPNVPINIINGGINGGDTKAAYERLDRDILKFNPDLTVVCLGLNDSNYGEEKIDMYKENLEKILKKLKDFGTEIIFMTPNCLNTKLSYHIEGEFLRDIAKSTMRNQNTGVFDKYMDTARTLCNDMNVTVCDCYAKWKMMIENDIDVTNLLSNYINHPTREMTWMFAIELVRTMFEK